MERKALQHSSLIATLTVLPGAGTLWHPAFGEMLDVKHLSTRVSYIFNTQNLDFLALSSFSSSPEAWRSFMPSGGQRTNKNYKHIWKISMKLKWEGHKWSWLEELSRWEDLKKKKKNWPSSVMSEWFSPKLHFFPHDFYFIISVPKQTPLHFKTRGRKNPQEFWTLET